MYINGRIGQLIGPFEEHDLLAANGLISQLTPETSKPVLKKLGIQTDPDTMVEINGVKIKIGKTGIYELDDVAAVRSLSFIGGATDSTIVDFVY